MSKPVIGIVGGIGAGKSTVAAELARLGCGVIDADRIGHELLDESDVRAQIVEMWGPSVLDENGRVDRRCLAGRVFTDPAQLSALNVLARTLGNSQESMVPAPPCGKSS